MSAFKRNAETFVRYLDGLSALGTVTGASKTARLSTMTIHRYAKASRIAEAEGDQSSVFWFEYEGEADFFHNHEQAVFRSIIGDVAHGAIIRARDGAVTQAYVDGQPIFLRNEEFTETAETRKWDLDEDLALLGYPTRWKRDANFKKVPSLIRAAPSNEMTLAILAAFTKRFAKRLDVSHQHNVGGVLNINAQPKVLAAVQVVDPVSEAIADITDGEFTEEPSSVEPIAEAEPVAELISGHVKEKSNFGEGHSVSAVASDAPAPRVVLTDLQRDLVDRARSKGLPT